MILEKKNVIVDIDGTVADLTHRLRHIQVAEGGKKDWDSFFDPALVRQDKPIRPIIRLLWALQHQDATRFWFVSGRPDSLRETTAEWLFDHIKKPTLQSVRYFTYEGLIMRRTGDHRPDHLVKRELYLNVLRQMEVTPETTLFVLDDRKQVVDMWRGQGFKVLQVEEGLY